MKLVKLVSFGIALLFIQACSHPIEIVGQGDVTSASGNRNCSLEEFQTAQDKCTKNYAVGAYQETYYATPRAGYMFDHWGNNYCPNATPPNYDCSFDFTAATVKQFWGQTMPPLKAVFTPAACGDAVVTLPEQCDDGNQLDGDACSNACTINGDTDGDGLNDNVDPCPLNAASVCAPISGTDIVFANGREWAQLDLFTNLSSTQVLAVCPAGICVDGGVLNGHDLTGWRLAAVADVDALVNFYTAQTTLTPDLYTQPTLFWFYSSSGTYPPGRLMTFFTDFRYTTRSLFQAPDHGNWLGFALASPIGAVGDPTTFRPIQLTNCTADPACATLFQGAITSTTSSLPAAPNTNYWMIKDVPVGGYLPPPFGPDDVIDKIAEFCASWPNGISCGIPWSDEMECCGGTLCTVNATTNITTVTFYPPNSNCYLND